MKKLICYIFVLLILFACVFMSGSYYNPLYIDPISATTIGGTALGLMDYWGISFTMIDPMQGGLESFMSTQVDDFVAHKGSDIGDVFGAAIAVDVAGKLVVGQTTYNAIKEFVGWIAEKFGLGDSESVLSAGGEDGVFVPTQNNGQAKLGVIVNFSDYRENVSGYPYGKGYKNFDAYASNVLVHTFRGSTGTFLTGNWMISFDGERYHIVYETVIGKTGAINTGITAGFSLSLPNKITWDGSNYNVPDTLPDYKQWEGTVGGYSQPDTNIDDLIGGIFEGIEQGDLDLTGEVIDVPVDPTPAPTFPPPAPDIPLQDVPWGGLNDLVDQTGKDIIDSVGEGAQDITGAIEGVQEGVSDLTDIISEALTPPEIDEKTFDLRELFPFCIPFDIYHLLQKFDSTPVAPHVQLPIVISSIGFSYTMDLDFSVWDPVAAAMRTVELIVYALGLAWATSKVIKW